MKLSDIRGDLHVHSNWSDGRDSIEEMALAARALGYQYIAITDHSKGLGIAHGLNEERIREQRAEIRRLNESLKDFRILAGIEVDIRADGSLDLPDEILAELDVVVAAVHSAMGQEQEKMTRRIIRAMENPHVDIIAHPTCRLLGAREAIALDMEAVFRGGGPDRHRPGDQRHAGPPRPQGHPHLPGQGAGREAVAGHGCSCHGAPAADALRRGHRAPRLGRGGAYPEHAAGRGRARGAETHVDSHGHDEAWPLREATTIVRNPVTAGFASLNPPYNGAF